jgi:hypothetical protein
MVIANLRTFLSFAKRCSSDRPERNVPLKKYKKSFNLWASLKADDKQDQFQDRLHAPVCKASDEAGQGACRGEYGMGAMTYKSVRGMSLYNSSFKVAFNLNKSKSE